ncbi:MAG: GNAT family N-acetyltransferase [Clostridiales bacterium]
MFKIRKANIEDVEEIVDINIRVWKTTYNGIINNDYLLDREKDKAKKILKMKNSFKSNKIYRCVSLYNNKIVGFIIYGELNNIDKYKFRNTGEIYALYILKDYQRMGLGRNLVKYAINDLVKLKKYNKMVIWSLDENPNINFYLKLGGSSELREEIIFGKQVLGKTGFVFSSLNNFLE